MLLVADPNSFEAVTWRT